MVTKKRQIPLLIAGLVGMVMAMAAVLITTPTEVWAAVSSVKVLSSTQTVSPASPSPVGTDAANLKAARNEFESFQVFVQADGAGIANLRVDPGKPLGQIDPATGQPIANGATIPAGNLTFYREHYLDITTRSDAEGALGPWTDALIPEKDYIYGKDRNAFPHKLGANEKAVAWVDILVPENQPAGTYRGTVLVKDDAGAEPAAPDEVRGQTLKEVPVTIEVKGFTIPSETTLDSAFMMGQQPSGPGMDDPCMGHPGFCSGAETRWKLYAMYGRAGLENRLTQPNAFGVGDAGNPPLPAEEALFDKYGLPLINGLSSAKPLGDPGRSRLNGARLTTVGATEWCGFQSNANTDYQSWCLDRWEQLAKTHGFADRFFLYTDDELFTQAAWTEFKERAAYAKNVWPGVRTLVTGPVNSSAVGTADQKLGAQDNNAVPLIDDLAPVVNYMDNKTCQNVNGLFVGNQRGAYNDFLAQPPEPAQPPDAKNRLWLYTSNMSFSSDTSEGCLYEGWPGYAVDQPDTQARTMGWMSYYYDVSGELYWKTTQSLDTAWTNQYEQGGNGDGNLFYPGTPAKIGGPAGSDIPVESIRLKKIRDGREDYEYMKEIEKRDRSDGAADPRKRVNDVIAGVFGDKDYRTTACPDGSTFDPQRRSTAPDGGCGLSAMYTTPSAAQLDRARLQLWNLIGPDNPPVDCQSATSSSEGVTGAGTWADPLKGTPGDDVILGTPGDDVIEGLGGNDLLCGRGGYDTFRGGPGDDTIDGEDASNAVMYEGGDAPVGVGVKVDLAAGTATGHGADKLFNINEVYGTPNKDEVVGDAEQNYLEGRDGDDSLNGGGGSDGLAGGPGSDRLNSRDGVADEGWGGVKCGDGTDYVTADAKGVDTINVDCEGANIDYHDTTAPDTAITSGPSGTTRSTSASFAFSSTEAGSRFECSLDGAAFGSCASPKGYAGLASRSHTFRVRAIDAAGNVDATPAARTWTVDAILPTVSGMSPRHASVTSDVTPTIRAIVRDNLTNLQKANIKLYVNGVLISPTRYSYNASTDALVYNSPKVAKGKKTVRVVATDAAKNVRSASWYFTVR